MYHQNNSSNYKRLDTSASHFYRICTTVPEMPQKIFILHLYMRQAKLHFHYWLHCKIRTCLLNLSLRRCMLSGAQGSHTICEGLDIHNLTLIPHKVLMYATLLLFFIYPPSNIHNQTYGNKTMVYLVKCQEQHLGDSKLEHFSHVLVMA